jgi:hypothetical protein
MKKITIFLLLLVSLFQLKAQYSSTNIQGVIVPKYMGSGGSTRLPVTCRLRIVGLNPSTMYQYSSRGMAYTDLAATTDFAGAGNPMLIDTLGFKYYTGSSVSFSTGASIDTFYTDKTGTYEGWFGFVYTANSRFAAGKHVYFGLTVRGGITPTTHRMYCSDSVRVLGFSSTSNTGDSFCTAVWGKSMTAARNFVATYDDAVGLDRPLSLTYAESEGITVASSAGFYTDSVNGKTGNWGAIMPNTNKNGIRRSRTLCQYRCRWCLGPRQQKYC